MPRLNVTVADLLPKRNQALVMLASLLTACTIDPTPHHTTHYQPLPPPATEVFYYPARGQGPVQQDRDRYECYLWAKQQTGFDPSDPAVAPHHQVRVVPVPPPGHDTAAGAATGAAIGAIAAGNGDTLEGMVAGAIAGAALGAASDAAREAEARRRQDYYNQQLAQRRSRHEFQADRYRRAMSACLTGRGYSVE